MHNLNSLGKLFISSGIVFQVSWRRFFLGCWLTFFLFSVKMFPHSSCFLTFFKDTLHIVLTYANFLTAQIQSVPISLLSLAVLYIQLTKLSASRYCLRWFVSNCLFCIDNNRCLFYPWIIHMSVLSSLTNKKNIPLKIVRQSQVLNKKLERSLESYF